MKAGKMRQRKDSWEAWENYFLGPRPHDLYQCRQVFYILSLQTRFLACKLRNMYYVVVVVACFSLNKQ